MEMTEEQKIFFENYTKSVRAIFAPMNEVLQEFGASVIQHFGPIVKEYLKFQRRKAKRRARHLKIARFKATPE